MVVQSDKEVKNACRKRLGVEKYFRDFKEHHPIEVKGKGRRQGQRNGRMRANIIIDCDKYADESKVMWMKNVGRRRRIHDLFAHDGASKSQKHTLDA